MSLQSPFFPVVVAPTYNNARTLRDIVARLALQRLPIIVVNDGSRDETADILAECSRSAPIHVITHSRNRGKAAALHSGFASAAGEGFTHAITIDTDGQLDPQEIPRLCDGARTWPDALVIGVRDETAADYPARSRTGRRISNFLVRLESGRRVSDSQCGFRAYPLGLVQAIPCGAGHFGFETEILTRAVWAGCEIREASVTCRYLPAGQRVSHFRPWLDTIRAAAMHARLIARAMTPWPHPKWPARSTHEQRARWRRLINWLSPARAWRELRDQRVGGQELAAGLAVGVFIANLPLYGLQTALSLYAARRLHLHPLAVVAGSHVSTPPVGPVLIVAAIGAGHFMLHGTWLSLPGWDATWQQWLHLAGSLILEWTVGGVVIGVIMAAGVFALANYLFRFVRVGRN